MSMNPQTVGHMLCRKNITKESPLALRDPPPMINVSGSTEFSRCSLLAEVSNARAEQSRIKHFAGVLFASMYGGVKQGNSMTSSHNCHENNGGRMVGKGLRVCDKDGEESHGHFHRRW